MEQPVLKPTRSSTHGFCEGDLDLLPLLLALSCFLTTSSGFIE